MKKHLLFAAFLAAAAASGAVMDGIAAKVNNDVITIGDVLAEVRRNPAARENFAFAARDRAKLEALYREAVESLVDRRLILSAAADKKMDMQEWVVDNRVREIVKENFHGDRNELEAELQRMVAEDPDVPVLVRGDERLEYGAVMGVVKIVYRCKVRKMALVTEEK